MNKNEMITTALQLKALLTVIAAVDPDNIEALVELPHAIAPAAELAEKLYCAIVES